MPTSFDSINAFTALTDSPLLAAHTLTVFPHIHTSMQDIAVDGWALTLLSPQNVGYASTCQTIGVTLGYFTSFTVFLALNNGAFCDSYVRSWAPAWLFGQHGAQVPLVSLPGYLRFWGWVFALATVGIAVLQPEKNFTEEEERERQKRHEAAAAEREAAGAENGSGIGAGAIGRQGARKRHGAASAGQPTKAAAAAVAVAPGTSDGASAGGYGAVQEVVAAYRQLWGVVQLPAVWALSAFLLTYRLGVLSTESAYSLKLIDKGVSKEALAFLVLFQFPVELCTAVLAGRWVADKARPTITVGHLFGRHCSAVCPQGVAISPIDHVSLERHL